MERKQECSLEIMEIATGKRTVLANFDKVIEAPNWMKDGKTLIYNKEGLIYKFDIENRTSQKIETGFVNHCNNDHVLSPCNKFLAVSHHTKEDGKSRIYILPIDGGEPRLVTENGPSYLHGWSKDGKTLAYCAERNGEYNIYTIGIDGGEETQLTFANGLDDDKVVYIGYFIGDLEVDEHLPDKKIQLRIMDVDGENDRVLAEFMGGQGTINVNSWSPDGTHIAFVSY